MNWWFQQMNVVIKEYLLILQQRQLKEDVTKVLQGVIRNLDYDANKFVMIELGDDGYIRYVNYDTLYLHEVLNEIIDEAKKQLQEISEFSYEMKLGMFTRNIYLAETGPIIKLKLKSQPYLFSELNVEMEPYGANNTLIKIVVDIQVNMYTVSPLIKETVTLICSIPLVIQIVTGKTLVEYPLTLN